MCGRFDTSNLTWQQFHDALAEFGVVQTAARNDAFGNNEVRPTDEQLVARRTADGGWTVNPMRWGLIPRSYKGRVKPSARGAGDGFQLTTFNCRVEPFTGEDPRTPFTYRFAFKERRCLVAASGWYEWTGAPGSKVKHAFSRVDGEPVWFAGLWDHADTIDQGPVHSFTIMTGKSAGVLADVHTRAPVVLEPQDFATWLDPAQDASALLQAVRPERFKVELAA